MNREQLEDVLSRGSTEELSRLLTGVHPADVADLIAELDPRETAAVFEAMQAESAAEMLDEANLVSQEEILEGADEARVVRALEELAPDEAADVLEAVSEDRADHFVDQMEDEEAREVEELLQFPADSAGRLMTTEFVALSAEATVREAVQFAQENLEPERTDDLYVVDADGRLIGVLPLRALLFTPPDTKIGSLAERDTVNVSVDTDQEEVARLVSKYDLLTIPVCDSGGVLRGIVTVDDVIEVIEEEVSEDMYRLAGTAERDPVHRSVLRKALLRAPWLGITLLGGILCCTVVGRFEARLTEVVALAFFLPLIPLMGGNVAIQASTIMVRGLATGEIGSNNIVQCALREMLVGLLLGVACGAVSGLAAYVLTLHTGRPLILAFVIGSAVLWSVLVAATLGSVIPMVCNLAGADPAIAAGPFVTTINDIASVAIYLSLAALLLSRVAAT